MFIDADIEASVMIRGHVSCVSARAWSARTKLVQLQDEAEKAQHGVHAHLPAMTSEARARRLRLDLVVELASTAQLWASLSIFSENMQLLMRTISPASQAIRYIPPEVYQNGP